MSLKEMLNLNHHQTINSLISMVAVELSINWKVVSIHRSEVYVYTDIFWTFIDYWKENAKHHSGYPFSNGKVWNRPIFIE